MNTIAKRCNTIQLSRMYCTICVQAKKQADKKVTPVLIKTNETKSDDVKSDEAEPPKTYKTTPLRTPNTQSNENLNF
jgi:hypothetical protein